MQAWCVPPATIVAGFTTLQEVDMAQADYEIQYQSLTDQQGRMCFPCDGQGHVDLDGLSPQAVENYLFVRAMVGRDFALPAVVEHPPN
jgi:hypothetical protein